MEQWRAGLDEAVADRAPVQVARPGRAWREATPVRMDGGALLCSVPGHDLHGGEEVRILVGGGADPALIRGTVMRCGVPVPDRGAHGVLIGFLDAVAAPVPAAAPSTTDAPVAGPALDAVISGGRRLSLLEPPLRVLELTAGRLDLQVPRDHTVQFPVDGALHLRVGATDAAARAVRGRIERVTSTSAHHVYAVELVEIEDHTAHAAAVAALRVRLGLSG